MRSHFIPSTIIEQKAASATKGTMRSHFLMNSAAMACALSAATAMMPGVCSGVTTAADYATDPTYSGGWAAGQNGGVGLGGRQLNWTDPPPPPSPAQHMSTSAAARTASPPLSH